MSEPCPCWLDNYSHPTDIHCCFRDQATPLEDYRLGQTPPCGHWHKDVPRPTQEANAING